MVNPIPKFAKNVWSKWNIRGVILASLTLQIILIFLAPFRKRSRKSILVLVLWSTYLLADYTANFCVGLISNKYGDEDSPINSVNDFLLAFWTPFLLLHLGGPDTITAFALEDNELWLRHMLGLIVQVCLTAYVFLLTLPENTLWIPTALVFTAGIIKFAERTRSLQLASVGNFRQSMVRKPDPGPNYAKLMEELKSRVDAGLPTEIVTMPEISDDPFFDINEPATGNADQGGGSNTSQHSHEQEPPNSSANARDQSKGLTQGQTSFEGAELERVDGVPPIITDDDANKEEPPSSSGNARDQSTGLTQGQTSFEGAELERVDGVPPIITDDDANKEELSDLEVVKGAYDYFKTFKGLVVDMIFSFHERSDSRNYLLPLTALDALRVIEVELNFIYQAFYTKASVITNKYGFCFRFGSVASLVAALVVFVYDQKRGCDHFDVKVTYTLLYGAVALDLVSVFMLVFSDHTFASIYSCISQKISDSDSDKETPKLAYILSCFLKLKRPKWKQEKLKRPKWLQNKSYKILCRHMLFRRWSESISGFNLVSYCLHKRKQPWLDKIIEYIGFKELVEQWKYEKKQPLLQRLWIFIHTELQRKSSDADDVETIQRICSSRGEWVIQEGELERKDLNQLMNYVERNLVTFDECLILWHIATDLLFYEDEDEKKKNENAPHDAAKGSGDGQTKNEDGPDIEKGIGDDGQKKNEIAPDNVKKGSDDEQRKNVNAPDDVKKGSDDGQTKKENDALDLEQGIRDGGQKKNENFPDNVKKGSDDGERKNENAQDIVKKGSDDGQRKNENTPDEIKKGSDDGQRKNENAPDNVKKESDDGQRKNENARDDDGTLESDFEDVDELRDFSKLLSDYMLYLVIMQPNMMSAVRGIAQIRFQDTCAEATNFFSKRQMMEEGERKMAAQGEKRTRQQEKAFKKSNTMRLPPNERIALQAKDTWKKLYDQFIKFIQKMMLNGTRCWNFFRGKKENETKESEEQKACKGLRDVCVDHEPSAVKGDRSKSLLFDACKLATVINGLKLTGVNKWKIIAQVWVELLSYAAANCIPITHVQQLSKGGEFLSLVWLLMTHFGLAKQFQIKEGHARAKLIVGEE